MYLHLFEITVHLWLGSIRGTTEFQFAFQFAFHFRKLKQGLDIKDCPNHAKGL